MKRLIFFKDRRSATGSLTLGAIIASIAFVMELTLLPLLLTAIKSDLSLSVVELAGVFNAYAISVALAVFCSGLIGDRVDQRRFFLVGAALFAIGSFLGSLSENLDALIVSRIVQGFGGGLFFPLVPVLLTQANCDRAGRVLMVWGGLVGIAAAILPILGGGLLAIFGWQAIFVAFAAVACLGCLFVVLEGGANRQTRRSRARPDYRKLLANHRYWLLLVYIFLTYGCFSYYLFHFPVRWHQVGFGDPAISVFLTCVWITFSVASFLLRNRMDGRGSHTSLVIAPVPLALSFIVVSYDPDGVLLQLTSAVLVGAGLALCNSPSTHLLLRIAPENLRAASASLDIIFARCGSVVMVTLFTLLQPVAVLFAIAGLLLFAVFASRVVQRDLVTID